jgi:enterochelin esterase family protein
MLDTVTEPAVALSQLIRYGSPSQDEVDLFVEENTFPLQEGSASTFVYRGQADRIVLHHWVHGAPSAQPFVRIIGSDLWCLTLELPERSRIEYKLEVSRNGRSRLIRDPLNPLEAHDPFGSNSVCHGPGYETPDWTRDYPEVPRGDTEIVEVESKIFGQVRLVDLYQPAHLDEGISYPLLIVHDGNDFVRYSSLLTVLDNLIYRGEIAPMLVALTNSSRRLEEYAADPRHAKFLVEELVPRLIRQYPIDAHSSSRGLLGASFGAVAALHTGWLFPGFFGRLLLQSGSFVYQDRDATAHGPELEPVVAFQTLFRANPRKPSDRVYISCGLYESLIKQNRELVPLLRETGMEVRYTEARDGHNWENWRDRLLEGLSHLFPGPAVNNQI